MSYQSPAIESSRIGQEILSLLISTSIPTHLLEYPWIGQLLQMTYQRISPRSSPSKMKKQGHQVVPKFMNRMEQVQMTCQPHPLLHSQIYWLTATQSEGNW
jgi:hypothetical protein